MTESYAWVSVHFLISSVFEVQVDVLSNNNLPPKVDFVHMDVALPYKTVYLHED